MYRVNVRAELTSALTRVILDATLLPTRAPPRVVTDIALLLAVLHSRVGYEVTAAFVHELVDTYRRLSADTGRPEAGKERDNALLLLAQLYNFKVRQAARDICNMCVYCNMGNASCLLQIAAHNYVP